MGGLFLTDYPPYPLWFCKKYEDPFGSPGAKPLAGAERQKEMSPKERIGLQCQTPASYLSLTKGFY